MAQGALEAIQAFALGLGYDRVYALPPRKFTRWQEEMAKVGEDHRAQRLSADVLDIMPEATAVVLMVKGYAPYLPFPHGFGHIPSYYVLTQITRPWCMQVQAFIRDEMNANAVFNPLLPYRATAIEAGAGSRGFNQILFTPEFGTYVNLSMVVTDAFRAEEPGEPDLPALCSGCGACARACPTGALKGDGTWDYRRCLRHHTAVNAYPEDARTAHASLLGCDICQNACPVNRSIRPGEQAPDEIIELFEIGPLLELRKNKSLHERIGRLVGNNMLNGNRLLNQAVMQTVRQGLTDLAPAVERLADDANPTTAELARWALERLA